MRYKKGFGFWVLGFGLLLSLFLSSAFAQERDSASGFQFDVLSFQLSAANYQLLANPDSARVDIYVAVPYSWLDFLNATEKYVADYEASITISSQQSVTGSQFSVTKTQALSVVIGTTEWDKLHELDLTRADASQYSFTLKQGSQYEVRIRIKDLTTHKELSASRSFTVLSFPSAAASISDILLYKSKEGRRITPHIGTDISSLKMDEAGLFCELYHAPQSTPFWLLQRIVSLDDSDEIDRSTTVLVSSGEMRMPVFLPFAEEDLWSGKYRLELFMFADALDTTLTSASALQSHALAYRSRNIEVTGVRGVPLAGLDLDDAISQLAYIATGNAYDSLFHAATKQEKRRAIMDFWEKTNWYRNERTTRPMEIFYRRIQYANEHFREMGQGWRSDRGKVYIMLGAPTSIEKHSYDAGNRPYEIWHYYDLNQQYYFTDQFMMGDYRLSSILPAPGTFLWQRETY